MTELDRIKAMYASGMSVKAIGVALGRSHQYPYRRLKKAGVKMRPLRGTGPEHSQWKGGRQLQNGYAKIWIAKDDPLAAMRGNNGFAFEHRIVIARALKRPLLRSESVHHINGDTLDNRIENLQLRHGKHGKGVAMCCRECGSFNIAPIKITEH